MASSLATSADFETFGTKLFSQVSQQNNGESIFFSPASIALALSMCTVGARNETLQQMLNVLGISSTEQLIKIAAKAMEVFSNTNKDKQIKLRLANRLYGQKEYKIQQDYLNIVQKSFQADIKLEDFINQGPKVVQTINTWVEEQTNNLIRDLLSPNDITPDTRLVLINCIYFKGAWENQFEEYLTNQNADFHESDGRISKIKLMYQRESFAYTENKNLKVQIAHLPYKSDNYNVSFVLTVILPNKGVRLEEVEQKLTSNSKLMKQVLSLENTRHSELLLHLPKFKMESRFVLNDVLIQLGMQNAFSSGIADFTGIVKQEDARMGLYISKVIHKAFIDVNEFGTEAAAATAVIMHDECCMVRDEQKPIEFKVDRPFMFVIQEQRQGLTLFHGKYLSSKN